MSKCAIMIDGGYLDKILANEYSGTRVDYGKLGDALAGKMERLRSYYYHCMPYQSVPPSEDEKKKFAAMDSFIYNLRKLPRFQFRQGKMQRIGNEYRQKRVDILMAVDLVRISSTRQVDMAIIITGDSDLVPAVEVARDSGVVVSLYYSDKARHDELLQACDERHQLSPDLIKTISR